MPMLMSLEGPQLSQVDRMHARLLGAAPSGMLRAQMQLAGGSRILGPFVSHPIVFVIGIGLGFWLGRKKRKR